MSSYYQHSERREQRYVQNPASSVAFGSRINIPVSIAPPLNVINPVMNGGSFIDDRGNGLLYSYREQTYTLPGRVTYYEWSG
ncbi:unnamed protein product [Adineta steineri]|uniref:Uncharacterized protein n=1 Tax=Adineta steineri TaxID=433720 RepID=A0A820A8F7_9BILA|nr:unnamed protein product [Adineta steineri]